MTPEEFELTLDLVQMRTANLRQIVLRNNETRRKKRFENDAMRFATLAIREDKAQSEIADLKKRLVSHYKALYKQSM